MTDYFITGTDGTRDIFGNGIGVAQLVVGVVGLGLVSGAGLFAVKYHQRTTKKFFSSLLTASNDNLSKIDYSYLSREPMFDGVGGTPINNIVLRDSFQAVAVIGANRSGKTIFISNYLLDGMFPWWHRIFFPPRGLFLIGNQIHPTIKEWLRNQISTTVKDDPWSAMSDLLTKRRNEQRIRLLLHKVFKTKLPRFLKPQPAIIIVDQAEELLRAYRSNFLVSFYNLAKQARDNDLFRLILVINTENAVKALELMNGGSMFDIIQGPKVSRKAVEKSYGENFAQIFDDCNGCIGVAMDYVADKKRAKAMTAKDFAEMKKRSYLENSCLVEEITREEYFNAQEKEDK